MTVSRGVAARLRDQAEGVPVARTAVDLLWPEVQDRLSRLASLPGADALALAGALLYALTKQKTVGVVAPPLNGEALAWLLEVAGDRIEAMVETGPIELTADGGPYEYRRILDALWSLPGEEGAIWFLRVVPRFQLDVSFAFQEMAVGEREDWSPEDWSLRLHRLCDAGIDPPDFLSYFGMARPPAESAPAQSRLACEFSGVGDGRLLSEVAENLRGYFSNAPEQDVALFWWPAAWSTPEALRALLALTAPSGYRTSLIEAALSQGEIDGATASYLSAELPETEASGEEAKWTATSWIDAGLVALPSGDLAGGSPWASDAAPAFVVDVPPGRYLVRLLVASHPMVGMENAVAVVEITDAKVVKWDPIPARIEGVEGYLADAGVGAFGAARALGDFLGELPGELQPSGAARHAWLGVSGIGDEQILAFTVGPQDQQCRSWLGVDANDRPSALATDLGLLDDPLSAIRRHFARREW